MSTIPAHSGDAMLTTDEAFMALLCSDPELLRTEFDAIIAASWATPPAKPGVVVIGYPPRRTQFVVPPTVTRPRDQPARPGDGESSRQRSPPPRP